MTVLGNPAGGAVGAGGLPPLPVAGGAGGAEGVGTKVIVDGTPVQMPGFCGTNSAQIPAKKERAA